MDVETKTNEITNYSYQVTTILVRLYCIWPNYVINVETMIK